jgi:hypothetical protein
MQVRVGKRLPYERHESGNTTSGHINDDSGGQHSSPAMAVLARVLEPGCGPDP